MHDHFRTGRIDWEDVRFFAALARHGSLSATARALRVNHATVSRRIAALEAAVQVKLFKRDPNGYQLTDAGRQALQAADTMESAAAALSQLEPETALTGLVRVTTTPSLAESFVIPKLAALQQQHPLLELEINAERRPLSLRRHQSDIALRIGRPEKGELRTRRAVYLAYRFYGTPAWRERIVAGAPPRFIGFDEAGADFPEAQWLAAQFENAPMALRCNNITGQIVAARAGFGIALLPHFLVANDSGLVEIDLSRIPPLRELWLLIRHGAQPPQRIRVVADFLFDAIRQERLRFEGG
ncbi:LysR family transcriptional regulator [Labrys sp. ZIDIC5]|uniref:LysR family transcriptional regulator n=1 Tax=Labrys sedimenti TaxID=3106036 RepID=UPI002ACADBFB|nr:LysR family transcriptional regulator [Labrys sp. ZIDIC5]MDZ5454861.1 LysR family transcriptional regulator [Labrys sp. ZIDIC5]